MALASRQHVMLGGDIEVHTWGDRQPDALFETRINQVISSCSVACQIESGERLGPFCLTIHKLLINCDSQRMLTEIPMRLF